MFLENESGILRDHTGKRSSSRVTSLLATLTLCGVAIGNVYVPGTEEASSTLLYILAGVALGPISMNRYFGEVASPLVK